MSDSVNFDRAATFYDETRGFAAGVAEGVAAFIVETAGLTKESRLLEIGIGTGRIALPLARHVNAIFGADISHAMMRVLLNKRDGHAVYLAKADAYRLPYPDKAFDAVVIVHVLHLVPDPVGVLGEVKRVLKADGRLLHGLNSRGKGKQADPVMAAWNANRPPRKHGHRWERTFEVLRETQWQMVTETEYPFTTTSTPRDLLEKIENRVWSSMWDMEQDKVDQALAAVWDAINAHHDGNADAVIADETGFTLQVMQPPT